MPVDIRRRSATVFCVATVKEFAERRRPSAKVSREIRTELERHRRPIVRLRVRDGSVTHAGCHVAAQADH